MDYIQKRTTNQNCHRFFRGRRVDTHGLSYARCARGHLQRRFRGSTTSGWSKGGYRVQGDAVFRFFGVFPFSAKNLRSSEGCHA